MNAFLNFVIATVRNPDSDMNEEESVSSAG